MANFLNYKDKTFNVGDMITIDYKVKDGEKDRIQEFSGILTAIKGGQLDTRMFTVRKNSKSGIGIERIIPVSSPFVSDITLDKKSSYSKAKLYFLKDLSDQQLRRKLYRTKPTATKKVVAKSE